MEGERAALQPTDTLLHSSASCMHVSTPALPPQSVLLQRHLLSWQQGWSGRLLLGHHLSCLMHSQLSDLNQILLEKGFHSLWGNGSHLSLSSDMPHLCLCDGFFLIPDVMLARLASHKHFSSFTGTVITLCSAELVCLP